MENVNAIREEVVKRVFTLIVDENGDITHDDFVQMIEILLNLAIKMSVKLAIDCGIEKERFYTTFFDTIEEGVAIEFTLQEGTKTLLN